MSNRRITQCTIDDVKRIYPEELREPLQWLFGYFVSECASSRPRLAAKLTAVGHSYDQSYIYKLFNGDLKFSADSTRSLENWLAAIEALQLYTKGEARRGKFPPIETETMRIIRDSLDAVRTRDRVCKWLIMSAETGRGKTYCLNQYRIENNHGQTVHLEAPAFPKINHLVHLIYKQFCTGHGRTFHEKEEALLNEVTEDKLIIIDNAQRLYKPNGGSRRQDCFSFLQKLQDETNCAICLVFVKDVQTEFYSLEEMLRGEAKGFFKQFVGRIGGIHRIIHLPAKTSDADLLKFAKAAGYTAPVATRLLPILRHLDTQEGNIRVLMQSLQDAMLIARAEGRPISPLDLLEHIPHDHLTTGQKAKLIAEIEAAKSA